MRAHFCVSPQVGPVVKKTAHPDLQSLSWDVPASVKHTMLKRRRKPNPILILQTILPTLCSFF